MQFSNPFGYFVHSDDKTLLPRILHSKRGRGDEECAKVELKSSRPPHYYSRISFEQDSSNILHIFNIIFGVLSVVSDNNISVEWNEKINKRVESRSRPAHEHLLDWSSGPQRKLTNVLSLSTHCGSRSSSCTFCMYYYSLM